jgi:hypothetical protein
MVRCRLQFCFEKPQLKNKELKKKKKKDKMSLPGAIYNTWPVPNPCCPCGVGGCGGCARGNGRIWLQQEREKAFCPPKQCIVGQTITAFAGASGGNGGNTGGYVVDLLPQPVTSFLLNWPVLADNNIPHLNNDPTSPFLGFCLSGTYQFWLNLQMRVFTAVATTGQITIQALLNNNSIPVQPPTIVNFSTDGVTSQPLTALLMGQFCVPNPRFASFSVLITVSNYAPQIPSPGETNFLELDYFTLLMQLVGGQCVC